MIDIETKLKRLPMIETAQFLTVGSNHKTVWSAVTPKIKTPANKNSLECKNNKTSLKTSGENNNKQ